jgi:protoheme IX farnesyltransferase
MIPFGFLPYSFGIAGIASLWVLLGCNIWMVLVSVQLFIKMDLKSARLVMFSSYFYLMIVLLALFANKA